MNKFRLLSFPQSQIQKRTITSLKSWATVDPKSDDSMIVCNRVNGVWTKSTGEPICIPDPLNVKNPKLQLVQNTSISELAPFFENLAACKKSGLHNPLKNPQR
jgi:1-pyrroline-5-carboxylate dehydrogenase